MTTLFARFPRLTILLVFLIIAAGVGALLTLGRQEDPTLIRRYGYVATFFPGASAERMEALITEPLEDALMELAELDHVNSASRAGASIVSVTVRDDLNKSQVDQAWTLVREQVDVARQSFPQGVAQPRIERTYVGAATMIVALSWRDGRDEDLGALTRLAYDLDDRFQGLAGTEETQVFGAADEEVRVVVDPDSLAALGFTTADVAGLIASSDAKSPAGQVRGRNVNLGVEFAGDLDSIQRVRDVILLQDGEGRSVRVGDVAEVEKGVESPPDELALLSGRRSIFVAAYLQPNLRVDTWTDRARDVVDDFMAEAPAGVETQVIFEQNQFVERRLSGLGRNLTISAVLVFVVLFFMMGWRAAFIVGAALPLTVFQVLFLMRLIDEPLHQMSVTGLIIALGLLIDNAIVMVDEYRLKRGKGASRMEAADLSVRHLFAPLLASTLTTVFAFAPIALMPGGAGEFIGMIGLSVIFAVTSSFVIAMTIVPALAVWFDADVTDAPQRFWRDGVSWAPLTAVYRALVRMVAYRPSIGFLIGLVIPAAGFVLIGTQPSQFFPPTDRNMFQLELVLPPGASIAETRHEAERATALIMEFDGVEEVNWVVGTAPPRVYYNAISFSDGNPSYASGWVRTASADVTRRIVSELQPLVQREFPAARFLTLPFEQGPPVPAPIEFTVTGSSFAVLDRLGNELRAVLSESKGVTYTVSGLRLGAPVAIVEADEAAAQLAGRRLDELARLVRADLDGVQGGSMLEGVEELPVRVILRDEARGSLDAVRSKTLPARVGEELGSPVSAFGDIVLHPEVAVIVREQGVRANRIYAFLDPFALPAETMDDFLDRLANSGFTMPPGYTIDIGGEAAERGETVASLLATAAPLLILIIGSLVLAFNSFSYAGIVGLVGVQSVGLAFFGIWLFDQPNGFMGIVGAMGLVGLAINGSIVVLSALKASPEACEGDPDAIASVTVDATRHIVSTTLTTIGGFVPLIVAGDSFWLPLATAIAGGVAGSAVLALFFAPAAFALLARGAVRKRARQAARVQARTAASAAE